MWPPTIAAQTTPAGLPLPEPVGAIALAGGGAAQPDVTRSAELPTAALGPARLMAFFEASSGSPGAGSLSTFGAGTVWQLRTGTAVALLSSWQQLRDVVQDPTFPDNGLWIGDWHLTLGVAQRLPFGAALGVSLTRVASTIFATQARTTWFSTSVAWRPVSGLRLVGAASGLAAHTMYRYEGASLGWSSGARWQAGLAVTAVSRRLLSSHFFLDAGYGGGVARWTGVAGDVVLRDRLTGRLGFSWRRPELDERWYSTIGAGFVVRIASLSLSYAFTPGLGELDLMPRHHVGLSMAHGP